MNEGLELRALALDQDGEIDFGEMVKTKEQFNRGYRRFVRRRPEMARDEWTMRDRAKIEVAAAVAAKRERKRQGA